MDDAWESADPVVKFAMKEFVRELIIWIQGGYHPEIMTKSFGAKPAVRGTAVVLSGQYMGEAFDDVLVFSADFVSQMKGATPGKPLLGRVEASGRSVALGRFSSRDGDVADNWRSANPGRLEQLGTAAVNTFADRERALLAAPAGQGPAAAKPFQGAPPVPQQESGADRAQRLAGGDSPANPDDAGF